MIIDSHTHVYRAPPGHHVPWTIENHLALLDRHAVFGSVLVQPSFFGTDHGELVAAMKVAPGRLRAVGVATESFSREEMDRLHEAGIRGLRFNFHRGASADLASAPWRKVIAMIEAKGWHLEINARDDGMAATLARLEGVTIPITVDHIGRPDPVLGPFGPGFRALLQAGTRQAIHIKLTSPFRTSMKAATDCVAAWSSTVGAHRMLWGSDCPWVEMEAPPTYERALEWIDDNIPARDRAAVLGLNAHAFYDFPAP